MVEFQSQFQSYLRLSERQRQVADLLKDNPNATNVEIAKSLGLSPARIGQIRKSLEEAET